MPRDLPFPPVLKRRARPVLRWSGIILFILASAQVVFWQVLVKSPLLSPASVGPTMVFDLLSLSTAQTDTSEKLASLLCCLPAAAVPAEIGYADTFRVVVSQFLDRFNFCLAAVKRSCIHFVTPQGRIIPFDTYNLFYRNGLDVKLRAAAKQSVPLPAFADHDAS